MVIREVRGALIDSNFKLMSMKPHSSGVTFDPIPGGGHIQLPSEQTGYSAEILRQTL